MEGEWREGKAISQHLVRSLLLVGTLLSPSCKAHSPRLCFGFQGPGAPDWRPRGEERAPRRDRQTERETEREMKRDGWEDRERQGWRGRGERTEGEKV